MLRLPFTRITLPDVNPPLKFETGDGLLQTVDVTLGEGERSSTCSIEIADKGLVYANGFFLASYARGGIVVNPLLLQAPSAQFSASPTPTPLPTPSPAPTPAPTPSPNPTPSPSPTPTTGIKSPTGVPLSSAQDGIKGDTLAREIVAYCLSAGVNDRGQIAYLLASYRHESGDGIYTEEIASGSAYEGRSDLGNTQPGDGVRFKGRGLVQITGRNNYNKFGKWLGEDFTTEPNNKKPALLKFSIPILVCGMTGVYNSPNFTGVTLGQYVNGSKQDFNGARRVVNGTDRASLIAGYATSYLARLDSLMPRASAYEANTGQAVIESNISTIRGISGLQGLETPSSNPTPTAPTSRLPGQPLPVQSVQYNTAAPWVLANFAMLDVIAKSIGTYELGTDAFNAILGPDGRPSAQRITDASKHPGAGKRAGKFGISFEDWTRFQNNSTIKVTGFKQDEQIGAAINLLKESGDYLSDLKAGKYEVILDYAGKKFPEMPGGSSQKLTKAQALAFHTQRLAEIQSAGSGTPTPSPSPNPTPSPGVTPTPSPSPAPGQTVPLVGLGERIIVEIGFNDGSPLAAYEYYLTGTTITIAPDILKIDGKAVLPAMGQTKPNTSYNGLNVEQLAEQIAGRYGLRLSIPAQHTFAAIEPIEYLDQSGLSDDQLLARESHKAGYLYRVENGTIYLDTPQSSLDPTLQILSEPRLGGREYATKPTVISAAGLKLVKDFEGLRLNAYQDSVGVWTIGWGHTKTARSGQTITESQAESLLKQDLAGFEKGVFDAVKVDLTQAQFDALVSFSFNVGLGAFGSSTLLKKLNQGDYAGAANELLRWDKAGGSTLAGLTRRRKEERALFLSGATPTPSPSPTPVPPAPQKPDPIPAPTTPTTPAPPLLPTSKATIPRERIESATFADEASADRITSGGKLNLLTGKIEKGSLVVQTALPAVEAIANGNSIGKGYESSITFAPTPELMLLRPGQVIRLPDGIFPTAFAREWRVDSLNWQYDGRLTGTLNLYLPVFVTPRNLGTPPPTPGITPTPGATPTPGLGGINPNARLTQQQIFDLVAPAVPYIQGAGIGSGYFVTESGEFLTAAHVVSGKSKGTLSLYTDKATSLNYEVIKADSSSDIAVCRITSTIPGGKVPITVLAANNQAITQGETVYAIGHPLNVKWQITKATVGRTDASCLSRKGCFEGAENNWLHGGKSGGPVCQEDGQVVGMSDSVTSENSDRSVTGKGQAIRVADLRAFYRETQGRDLPLAQTTPTITGTPTPSPIPSPTPTPIAPPSPPPSGTVNLAVPHRSQRDNKRAPSSTCNVTCIAMILLFAGLASDSASSQLEDDLDALVSSKGWQRTAHADLVKLMALYKVTSRFVTNGSRQTVVNSLNAGKPVIAAGMFTAAGHIIVIRGYTSTGLIANDPWGNGELGYSGNQNGENIIYSNSYMNDKMGGTSGWWLHLLDWQS